MPPRTISAIYAPVFMETMSMPEGMRGRVLPPLAKAYPQYMTIAWTIIGVPRKISTYTVMIASMTRRSMRKPRLLGLGAVRIMPVSRPIRKPAIVPTRDISIVMPTPLSIKL